MNNIQIIGGQPWIVTFFAGVFVAERDEVTIRSSSLKGLKLFVRKHQARQA